MQAFGKFATEHDIEYLTEHYLYFNETKDQSEEGELRSKRSSPEGLGSAQERDHLGGKISTDDLKALLKKKNKTVAGTIFLYNPVMVPKGYNTDRPLAEQGYEFDGEYTELQFEKLLDIFQSRISGCEGKLIEVKYLFNYNRPNIEPTSVLETFNHDIEKLSSRQSTRFSRELNYHDIKNIRLSGKFVFFAWGHKFDQQHHNNILNYAKGIFEQSRKIGKPSAYIYKKEMGIEASEEGIRFFHPIATGKLKTKVTEAIAKAFSTNPPQPTAYMG